MYYQTWHLSLLHIQCVDAPNFELHRGLLVFFNKCSRPEVFCKKGALRGFGKVTEKYLGKSLFFNKVAGLSTTALLKKRH